MAELKKPTISFHENMILEGSKRAPEEMLFSYKGVLYPSVICKPEILQNLETFEARRDDVILAGYPKNGTHWLNQILNDVVETGAKYTDEEKKKRNAIENELALPPRLEFMPPDAIKSMENLPSRRVIVTHLKPNLLPKSIFKSKAKVLLLIRNPKDTVVSYFHFNNKLSIFPDMKWDSYFTDFMNGKVGWGSYFDYIKEWDKYIDDENVTAITYEELKENPDLGVKKIAAFLGYSLNEEEIQSVIEKSSFKVMVEKCPNSFGEFKNILFRKGSVGDWRSLFSDSQNQEMDRRFEECLAGTKLGVKIKYEVCCKV